MKLKASKIKFKINPPRHGNSNYSQVISTLSFIVITSGFIYQLKLKTLIVLFRNNKNMK